MIGRMAGIAILFVFATLMSGCATTPASRFYTLSAASTPGTTSSNLSVTVGPVSVPAAVDRPEIVVDTSANEVWLDEFNRWAAPLQEDLSRVIAENLMGMLGTSRVTRFPQTLSTDGDYRVAIEVQRFESEPGKAATLHAVWIVRRAMDGRVQTGRTSVRETVHGNSYDALAAAHSRAAARLSQDIADALRAFASR